MPKLSVFIITKNEADNLAECIETVKWTDEIVVVDDFSSDNTVEIAKKYTDKVIKRKLYGFGQQKQFALEQTTGEWVFSLDADERVSPKLAEQIKKIVADGSNINGYYINRKVYYLGKSLHFGGVGSNWVVRLFKRDKGKFSSSLVHEHVAILGKTGKLRGRLLHYTYKSLGEHLQKIKLYTGLIAQQKYKKGKRFSFLHYLLLPLEFIKRYFLLLGILDGMRGFVYSAMASYYVFLKYYRLRELKVKRRTVA